MLDREMTVLAADERPMEQPATAAPERHEPSHDDCREPSRALLRVGTDEATLTEWQLIDRRLRTYRHHRAQLDAAELFDLARAENMRLHWSMGHSTMLEYMEFALGYTPHVARERLRVARNLVGLPAISGALACGRLTFSAVRELTRVATVDTEDAWLAASRDKTVHEIEEMVAGRAAGDLPEDPTRPDLRERPVRLLLPPEAFALWRQARMELANERGAVVTDADVAETLARRFLNPGTGEAGPAHLIAYTQCRNCKRATQNGAGREIDIAPTVFETAACDARLIGSVDGMVMTKATKSVTPRMREQLFARDHGRCQVPGCRATRHLHVHHLISQAEGGPNELWNMILLCSAHHHAFHDGLLSITGRVGPRDEVKIGWTHRPPWTPEEAAALDRELTEEKAMDYWLRERKPRGRRVRMA